MNKEIQLEMRNVFGVDRIYPVCEKSQIFARITGLKTLQPTVIKEIENLGYELETRGEKL